MEPGAYAIVGSALLQQRRLELVANNLAQINTPGYKADVPVFRIDDSVSAVDLYNQPTMDVVDRSAWQFTHIDFSQGSTQLTNNPLDLALSGDGFFVLKSPDGPRYTRSGRFSLNGEGTLISTEGWPVLGTNDEPIQIVGADIKSGGIFINEAGQVVANRRPIGQIKIADFAKPYPLEKKGFSTFATISAEYQPTTPQGTKILQGYLEGANVSPISEMTKLIEISRLYESYQKMLQSFDQVEQTSVNELGSVNVI